MCGEVSAPTACRMRAGFHHDRAADGVVGGAGGTRPRIQVPAEHHHFISLVRAANLCDGDVRRLAFRVIRVLNVELDSDRRAVLDDAEDAAVVVVPKNRARRLRRRVVVNLSAAVLRDDEAGMRPRRSPSAATPACCRAGAR
jgi:hypothetical protein